MVKGLIYQNEEHLRNFLRKFKCEQDVVEIMVELFNNHLENNKKLMPHFKSITYAISQNAENKSELFKNLRLMWKCYKETNRIDLKFMTNEREILESKIIEKPKKSKLKLKMKANDYYVEVSEEYNPPNTHGIYFLYSENKELEYIGKSTNLANRIQTSAMERGSIYARYIETKTLADMHIMEIYFIGKYKPIKNYDSKSEDEITFEINEYSENDMSDYFKVLNITGKIEWKSINKRKQNLDLFFEL